MRRANIRWAWIVVLGAAFLLAAFRLAPGGAGESPAAAAIANCTGGESLDFGCYQRRYRAMAIVHGPRAAVRDLSARSTRVGYLRAACHQLMHGIGRES